MTRNELSYDSHGINGPDEYRSRIATFAPGPARDKYGPLFEAAPELLAALQALTITARTFRNVPKKDQYWTISDDESLNAAFAAIARATGAAQ